MKKLGLLLLISFVSGFFYACTTGEATVSTTSSTTASENRGSTNESAARSSIDWPVYGTKLSDLFGTLQNDEPEAFFSELDNTIQRTGNDGFRIQIFSGTNLSLADTLASVFRIWADTTISGYQAQTYVLFNAPYYRVHVGDFFEREKAISYAQMVKRRFKDAWVVHDLINPEFIPADTARIRLK